MGGPRVLGGFQRFLLSERRIKLGGPGQAGGTRSGNKEIRRDRPIIQHMTRPRRRKPDNMSRSRTAGIQRSGTGDCESISLRENRRLIGGVEGDHHVEESIEEVLMERPVGPGRVARQDHQHTEDQQDASHDE